MEQVKRTRQYNGPKKGSQEAKDRMAKVRAAQWAKNGLVVSDQRSKPPENGAVPHPSRY
mgnify:CR=1 FL=1